MDVREKLLFHDNLFMVRSKNSAAPIALPMTVVSEQPCRGLIEVIRQLHRVILTLSTNRQGHHRYLGQGAFRCQMVITRPMHSVRTDRSSTSGSGLYGRLI